MNSVTWWLIALLNLIGYFIYSFGQISRGASKELIKFTGGVLFICSFGLMVFLFGGKYLFGLIGLSFVVTAPTVGILIAKIEKKLFPYRIKIRKAYAKKLNVTEEEVERVSQMNNDEFQSEMRKKYPWLNK